MKKALMALGICGTVAMTGCGAGDNNASPDGRDGGAGIYQQSGNTLNVNDNRPELYNENGKSLRDRSEDFGYVRHQKTGVMGADNMQNAYQAIDREQIADMISRFSLMAQNVDDVSTLVTDEEVLIVYATDSPNRNETADQVKRMAMSVVPRWFHVYVSDDTSLRKEVENYATLDTDSRNVSDQIDGLIKQMLKSPQGRPMSSGENANGEAKGELNEETDKDDLSTQMKKGQ
ncbi:YhcN/YlaJ family sporulation lipoprotein [Bacillus sp. ISL-35]|uniref:YhcN/YlaJ family sporulation lipoprotein n=1 Tax=Bacillus sp. ISL-35 TaxID=2819122 RepID=UPI001BE7C489|nr:YhcN/YlaJ family sporulation lipoprotein [Bacillus sp. ISL-35]MBT2679041.1 YhcN/YlaJ family sporulation lipoprotein [Bacillus sp. ISL-35]MBT2704038.1 YhcN/YlaJ family sporulation lipoprotein [Chryseobacterium sp. ISL-80]